MFTVELTVLRSVQADDLPDYPTSLEHLFHGLLDLIFPTTILPLKMFLSVGHLIWLQACPSPLRSVSSSPGLLPHTWLLPIYFSSYCLQPSLHPHCRLLVKGAGTWQGHMCNFVQSDKSILSFGIVAHSVRWVIILIMPWDSSTDSLPSRQVMFPRAVL